MTVWFGIDTDGPREKERDLYSRNAFAIVSLPIFPCCAATPSTLGNHQSHNLSLSPLSIEYTFCVSLSLLALDKVKEKMLERGCLVFTFWF